MNNEQLTQERQERRGGWRKEDPPEKTTTGEGRLGPPLIVPPRRRRRPRHVWEGPHRHLPFQGGADPHEGKTQGGAEGAQVGSTQHQINLLLILLSSTSKYISCTYPFFQPAEEEGRRPADALPSDPEEDRGDEADDGGRDEGGGLLPGRGQVRLRGLQPAGAAERQQGAAQDQDQEGQRGRRQPARLRVLPGRVGLLRVRGALQGRAADTDPQEELPKGKS